MKLYGRTVIVPDGNIERALRKFKKKVQSSNVLQDLRRTEGYIKPTQRRKLKASAARNRWQRQIQARQIPPRMY